MSNELTPLDVALKNLLGSLLPIAGVEDVDFTHAAGRIVATDLLAPIDVPGADNSAMDGYAIHASDLEAASSSLRVSQRIKAGSVGLALEPGTAARIFTGAPLPPGADTVVMQEDCQAHEDSIKILQAVSPGENVRHTGEDIRKGTVIFSAGHRLKVQDMTLLASTGITTLKVRQPLKVAVLTTGDELVRPGTLLSPGKIYNSNYYAISSLLEAMGMEVMDCGIIADDLDITVTSLKLAAEEADCIISSGGVSVGEEDHVKAAVNKLGSIDLWKLAIKPGKPFAYGSVQKKPFFGLPGNPVSAFVSFVLVVRPALLVLSGAKDIAQRQYPLPAGFEIHASGDRQQYLRVALRTDVLGSPSLILCNSQSSGAGSSLSGADGLAVVPPFTSINEGDMLDFIPFAELVN